MTNALAVTENKPRKIRVPELDSDVYILPCTQTSIKVYSHAGLLIDNLLYSLDAQMMQQREGGPWYFVTAKVLVPTLAPKKTGAVIDAVTRAVNTFMEQNPDYLDVLILMAWEKQRASLEREIQGHRGNISYWQDRITDANRHIREYQKNIKEAEQKLAEHNATRPTGHTTPEAPAEGVASEGAIEGTVVVASSNGVHQP